MKIISRGTRIFLVTVLCSIASVMWVGCSRSPHAVSDRAVAAGKKLMAKGDYRRAVLEFKNAVQAMPGNSEAHFELANAHMATGDLVSAGSEYKRALEADPKNTAAAQKLAQVMAVVGDRPLVEEAERRLNALLDASPADVTALNTLAFAELKLGKRGDALRHLEEVVAKAPRQISAAALLAHTKLMEKDIKGAEDVLLEAAKQNPDTAEVLVLLGRFYSAIDRLQDAELQFRQALKIQSNNGPALFYLGMMENAQGRKQPAEERFRTLSTHPEKIYWPVFGMFLFQEGRKAEALKEFERLYAQSPDDRLTRTRLIAVYQALSRSEEAEKLVNTVLSRNGKDVSALLQRSELRLERGKYTEAQEDLNQVLHDNATMPEAHYLQARIYEKNGSILAQRQELNETLRLNPLFLAARIALARLLTATNASRTALGVLEETPAEQKASLVVLAERNWVFWTLGDIQEMRKGVELGLARQRTPDLLVQNAWLNLDQRNFNGARLSAEEALRAAPEDIRALEILARSYANQNQADAGLARIREHASHRPNSAAVQLFMGQWLQAHGDSAGARAALTAAKTITAGAPDTELALVQLDLLESKWKDGRQKINEILTANPKSITARYWLAQVEEIEGNRDRSIEQYRKVITADPTHANALNNLAFLLGETGRASEALPLAQRAKELAPANPAVADTLGWVLYRNGLYTLAIQHLEEANHRQATAARASHLSMAYWKTGSAERARAMLERARKMDPTVPDVKEAQTLLAKAAPGPSDK